MTTRSPRFIGRSTAPFLVSAALTFPTAAWSATGVPGGDTELMIELGPGLREDGPWHEWLDTALRAADTATGRFPRRRVVIDLRPAREASRAIAFGRISREDPPRIVFWVAPDADSGALGADWRTYHEFAHLLIPFPGNRDIWFTEGLASYYQYILQSRAGLIAEREAWTRLLAGFERGLRDPAGRGRTLRDLSPDMWRENAFRRVYWTGAAFFLRVDVRLRNESRGKQSLDTALARFHECCLEAHRRWSAVELVERLGSLTIPSVWRDEYRRTIDARAAPDFRAVLAPLGIETGPDGPEFRETPGALELRRSIAGLRRGRSYPESSTPP